MRRSFKIALIFGLCVLISGLLWELTYPAKYDPKNPHYVLWKLHLATIDLDRAVAVMHHDRRFEEMILGKSEKSLSARFGYLLPPEAASPCYQSSVREAAVSGDKVLFLRDSDYMIVFHDGVAIRVDVLSDAKRC